MLRYSALLATALLAAVSFAAEPDDCRTGTPEERLACLTRQHCPVVVTEADRSECYRQITLTLLGHSAAPGAAAPANVPTPQPAPEAPAPAQAQTAVAPRPAEAPRSTPPQTSVPPAPAPPAERDPTAEFGLEWNERPARAIDEITARIVHLETQVRGNYLLVLDNGQVWEQNLKSRTRLKEGDEVRIQRGSLRSFKLVPEKSTPTNVSRIICHGEEPDPRCARLKEALVTGTH